MEAYTIRNLLLLLIVLGLQVYKTATVQLLFVCMKQVV